MAVVFGHWTVKVLCLHWYLSDIIWPVHLHNQRFGVVHGYYHHLETVEDEKKNAQSSIPSKPFSHSHLSNLFTGIVSLNFGDSISHIVWGYVNKTIWWHFDRNLDYFTCWRNSFLPIHENLYPIVEEKKENRNKWNIN